MPVIHKTLTDPEIHEPKGISTANAGEVYVADGAGSGAWLNLRRNVALTGELKDVSTTEPERFGCPTNGVLSVVTFVLDASLSASFTLEILVNNTIVASLSIPAPSAPGTVFTLEPSSTVYIGDLIEARSNGLGTAGVSGTVCALISEDIA